nr:hypothetical protein [uncultured Cohaesibacter sp.]
MLRAKPSLLSTLALPLALMAGLAGCQTMPMGMEEMGEALSSGEEISGEAQWGFSATSGDVLLVGLQDASGVLKSTEVIPTPGVQHADFVLSISSNDRTKCASRGSCRYSAELRAGTAIKASGYVYYTTTQHPVIMMTSAIAAPPEAAAAAFDAPTTSQIAAPSTAVQRGNHQGLPAPVYR